METKYKVLDLQFIYAEFLHDGAYLILSEDDETADVEKKIKLAENSYVYFRYKESEKVRIILQNEETQKFEIFVVPCRNGIYNLYEIVKKKYITYKTGSIRMGDLRREEQLIIGENATLIDGIKNRDNLELIVTGVARFENTNLSLKRISRYSLYGDIDMTLFYKCLQDETITTADLSTLVDDELLSGGLILDFGVLEIHIDYGTVWLKKRLNEYEEIMFTLDKKRIMIPSIFVAVVLKAESKKRLLSCLEEYYLCGN